MSEQVARDRRLAGVLELERAPLVEQRAHRRVVGQPQRAGFAVFRLDRLPQIEAPPRAQFVEMQVFALAVQDGYAAVIGLEEFERARRSRNR